MKLLNSGSIQETVYALNDNPMRIQFALATAALALAPFTAGAVSSDLGIHARDITFSKPLIAGERVRLYGEIENFGTEDVSGYVTFFQGSIPIGDSQVVSVRADGQSEDVYVDFTVPNGAFNIRAEIRGTDPGDQNPANDIAMTGLFEPKLDADRDGVEDAKDNCPSVANGNQADLDVDKTGDACDTDIDGDGVVNGSDAYPYDQSKSKIPPPPAPVVTPTVTITPPVPTPAPKSATTTTVKKPAAQTVAVAPKEEPVPEVTAPDLLAFEPSEPMAVSPKAVFTSERTAWNAFRFSVSSPETAGEILSWNFGDGATSVARDTSHKYRHPGAYIVMLTITGADGKVATDQLTVRVPFFSFGNPAVIGLLVTLGLAMLIGIIVAVRASSMQQQKRSSTPTKQVHVSEEDDEDLPEDES